MLTGNRYTSTWKVKVACYDRQSEWCMRTHYIGHPTVPFPALSHIPSPLLHTSPTHPHPSTTTAGQTQHSHLRRMNNTLASNTLANRSLSHEPKTRSPPPPSFPAQQAAQAIHSSPLASASLSTSSSALLNLALVRPPRTGPSLARTKQSGAPLLRMASHARKRYNRLTCTPGCLWERFRTSHLEREARAWPSVVPGRDRLATFTAAR